MNVLSTEAGARPPKRWEGLSASFLSAAGEDEGGRESEQEAGSPRRGWGRPHLRSGGGLLSPMSLQPFRDPGGCWRPSALLLGNPAHTDLLPCLWAPLSSGMKSRSSDRPPELQSTAPGRGEVGLSQAKPPRFGLPCPSRPATGACASHKASGPQNPVSSSSHWRAGGDQGLTLNPWSQMSNNPSPSPGTQPH